MNRKNKYYTFCFILYKDSLTYDYSKILGYIESSWASYAYIVHSPEKDESKEHIHVLVHFDNKRYISAISKEIGLEENYIQPCNLIPYLRYLIHFDDEDKIQYSPYEVYGPLQSKLLSCIKSKKEEHEQVACIVSYIAEFTGTLHIFTLTQFVLENNLYSAFRRNYVFFKDLVLEHNRYL